MVIEKGPDQNEQREKIADDVNEDDDFAGEEYNALNDRLDQLNGWLDQLETENASIHQQLLDLLNKNKSTREEFQKILQEPSSEREKPDQNNQ